MTVEEKPIVMEVETDVHRLFDYGGVHQPVFGGLKQGLKPVQVVQIKPSEQVLVLLPSVHRQNFIGNEKKILLAKSQK